MAEKIVSPGVFTNEIDQSFIPAALGEVGGAIVGPTVKGPVLEPTIVSSYGEFVRIFGELIESGSDKYQYLTSHTAREYLRQGGPLTVVRVGTPNSSRATATIGKTNTSVSVNATSSMTFSHVPSGSAHESSDELQFGDVHFTFVSSSVGLSDSATQVFVTHGNNVTETAQNLALKLTSTNSTTGLSIVTASAAVSYTHLTLPTKA